MAPAIQISKNTVRINLEREDSEDLLFLCFKMRGLQRITIIVPESIDRTEIRYIIYTLTITAAKQSNP